MSLSQDNFYIAEGVKEDCLSLIDKFSQNQTYSFEKFLEIWKEMKFSYIFFLRNIYAELLEYTEEVFLIVKNLWLSEKNFIKSVAAFYTLIGLYRKQPTINQVKIRLTLKDLQLIREFIKKCLEKQLTEVLFMYKELKKDEAFIFVASERQYGLDPRYRKYFSTIPDIDKLEENPKLNLLANELPQSILKYLESKNKLIGNNKELSSWINLLSGEKIKEMISKLSNLTSLDEEVISKIEKTLQCSIQEEENLQGAVRRKIKEQAFTKEISERKGRTSTDLMEYQNEEKEEPEADAIIDTSKSKNNKKKFLRTKLKYLNKVDLNETSNTEKSDHSIILDSFKKKFNEKLENNDDNDDNEENEEGNIKILEELVHNVRKKNGKRKRKMIKEESKQDNHFELNLCDIPSTSKGVTDWDNNQPMDCNNSDSSD